MPLQHAAPAGMVACAALEIIPVQKVLLASGYVYLPSSVAIGPPGSIYLMAA